MFGFKKDETEVAAASYDPSADAYFTAVSAAGGTLDDTFKTAWNGLVVGAKSDGWWTKLKFLHPNAGGNIGGAQVNAITPSTFDLGFVNSPTIDSTIGVTFDGTTQYATTSLIPNTNLASDSDWQAGVFMMTAATIANRVVLGSNNATTKRLYIQPLTSGFTPTAMGYNGSIVANGVTTTANNQFIAGSRTTTTRLDLFINGVSDVNNTTSDTSLRTTVEIYYGARNSGGSASLFANGKYCLDFVGETMNATDMANMYSRISTFLTAIGV